MKASKPLTGRSAKGTTTSQPIIVETSSERDYDNLTITTHSKPTPMAQKTTFQQVHGHLTCQI